jgi:prepilin-type N-terminal cleavage/methylation domain-containing protein
MTLRSGATLLEVLVVLAVLATLSLLVVSSPPTRTARPPSLTRSREASACDAARRSRKTVTALVPNLESMHALACRPDGLVIAESLAADASPAERVDPP